MSLAPSTLDRPQGLHGEDVWSAIASIPPPTLHELRDALRRVKKECSDDAWDGLCAAANVDPTAIDLDDDPFSRLLSHVGARDPLCRVVAMSYQIRRTAARKLAELGR